MPKDYTADAVRLLERLIATPSVSRNENRAADIIEAELRGEHSPSKSDSDKPSSLSPIRGTVGRAGNNVWIVDPDYDESRPTLLLNAHIDTVKESNSWTRPPFFPTTEGDRLYGLGANDCGGGLVTLLQAYRIITNSRSCNNGNNNCDNENNNCNNEKSNNEKGRSCPYNLIYLASAEEEVSGQNGIALALQHLPRIDVAIVGEPTAMQPAIAEKGLMVIDAVAHGKAGHAARNEGVNAIYEALDDLAWLRSCRFDKVSPLLGEVKVSVTMIEAGKQHNVVPDACRYVIDVRTNELYTNEEAFRYLQQHVRSTLTPRSFRLSSSHIAIDHPLVERCIALGMTPFGSPTLSDQALMPFPSLKLGPGDSARSHTADEYICLSELEKAIDIYTKLLGE